MTDDIFQQSASVLDRFESEAHEKAPHLVPLIWAVRDHGVGFLVIPQRATALDKGLDLLTRPFVAVIGDDTTCALGPDQYDRAALERLVQMADGVTIVASAPTLEIYATNAVLAVMGKNALIIETRPEQEIAWTHAVQTIRADMRILLCTTEGVRQ